MKNLKKFFAVLVVLTLMVSSLVVPASAADNFSYADQAQKLNDLGLYKGISTEKFVPDLGSTLNRETGIVMLLRIVGLEKAALDMKAADVTAALSKFKDAKDISSWAKNQVAYAVKNGLTVGTTETTFGPKASLSSKQYCTFILRQLGYTVDAGAQFDASAATLQEKGGLTAEEATKYANKATLIKDDLVGISFGSLKAVDKDGKVLYAKLIEAGVITADAAAKAGFVSGAIASVAATNGKINVTFDKDIIVAPAATDFTVTQSVYAASATTPTTTTVTAAVYGYTAATKTAELTVAPVTDAAAKTIYYSVAYKNGTPVAAAPVALATVTLDTASSLSSKVVEAVLTEATNDAAVAGTTFTVKDSANAEIKVTKAEVAGYDADKKTVLLTLASDTKAGSLYTLTVGSKTVNFGGKAAETTKPTISTVESTGFKEVTITYSEPVVLNGTTVAIAEKYGSKAALAVKSMKYNGKDKIVVETDEQKGSTLYGITVTGTADFSGNVMDKDEAKNFSGTAKDTSEVKVTGAAANNPEEAVVEFNVNIDTTTIAAANFKVEEAYGSKAVLPVTEARIAVKDDDKDKAGAALTEAAAKKNVIITVPGTKASTLYKVTVTGLKSEAGIGMSTTSAETYTTFAGMAKPTDPYTFTVKNNVATSNTLVEVVFANKVVEADAENIANYAIAEAYGNKAALAVKTAELQSDKKTVKLTTASMSANLYKLTVTGIKDVYGNSVKTDSSANIVTYTGVAVAAKITKINSIAYDGSSDTVVVVAFDQNVGTTLTDVAHYSINNDVGYPEKAVAGANANEVKLTLPKLTVGKIYTLTVKGLENADGVAMDTAGVSLTFVGKGNAATLPQLTAAIPADNQTLKIYFDRDVKDSKIDGPIWSSSTNTLVAGALTYTVNGGGAVDLAAADEYAYQDPSNKNILVVRIDTNDAFKTGSLKLFGATGKVDADYDELVFVAVADDPAEIVVDNVVALNSTTIRVYFNMPVYPNETTPVLENFADVNTTKVFGTGKTLSNPAPIDDTHKVYDFKLSSALTTGTYYLNIDSASVDAANAIIQDRPIGATGYVGMKDEDTSTAGFQQERPFAGSATAASDIKDVYAVMTDNKTIKVYYNVQMNESNVEDATNYTLYTDAAGTTLAKMGTAPGTNFDNTTDIGEVVYSTTDNTATITLNKAIVAGPVYVKFDTDIYNATGTAKVIDGTTAIIKQFAISTTAAANVVLKEASYDATAGVITVTMNQAFKTSADIDAADATAALADIKITVKHAAGDYVILVGDVTAVDTVDADDVAVDTPNTAFAKKIKITLSGSEKALLSANSVGKVEMLATANFTGINGNNGNADTSVVFAQ